MTAHTLTIDVPADSDMDEAGETVELEVDEDEYLLWAAREAGVWLPADCRQGWCCTCAVRLLEGEVDNSDARRYYESDREAGFVLACTAKPRSDVHVEAEAYEELLRERAAHDLPPGNAKLDR